MFDAVFAATGASRRVAPVMLGDEFLVRSLGRALRLAGRGHRQSFPAAAAPPLILGKDAPLLVFEDVTHRDRGIRLAVKFPRDEGDRASRHQLAPTHNAAPPFARGLPADLQA